MNNFEVWTDMTRYSSKHYLYFSRLDSTLVKLKVIGNNTITFLEIVDFVSKLKDVEKK